MNKEGAAPKSRRKGFSRMKRPPISNHMLVSVSIIHLITTYYKSIILLHLITLCKNHYILLHFQNSITSYYYLMLFSIISVHLIVSSNRWLFYIWILIFPCRSAIARLFRVVAGAYPSDARLELPATLSLSRKANFRRVSLRRAPVIAQTQLE